MHQLLFRSTEASIVRHNAKERKVQLRILTATTKYMVHDESNTTCSLTQPNLTKMKLHILGNNVKEQGDKRIGRQRS